MLLDVLLESDFDDDVSAFADVSVFADVSAFAESEVALLFSASRAFLRDSEG